MYQNVLKKWEVADTHTRSEGTEKIQIFIVQWIFLISTLCYCLCEEKIPSSHTAQQAITWVSLTMK